MEGDVGAGSSPSTPAPPPPSASELLFAKMSSAEETSSSNNNTNNNGLWGSLLERSSTAPPSRTQFETWGTSNANATTGNTGPDHAGGGPTFAAAAGSNSNNPHGAGGLLVGGSIVPPSRPKTTEPSLNFIDEYSGGGGGGGGGGAANTATSNGGGSMSRLPPGLDNGASSPGGTSSNLSAETLERQFLFEAGNNIRRPASTGLMAGTGTGGNGDSLALSGVASAEVLKSLGLEIPGYTSSKGSAPAPGGDGIGGGSAASTDDARRSPASKSGSALMDLIQEEMRSGRASAASPAIGDDGIVGSRSVSTAPPQQPTVDEISAGLQSIQVGDSKTSQSTQYSPQKQSQNRRDQYQPHHHYQQQGVYHQPSPVFTGMSHNSPPDFYLGSTGGGGVGGVSPHSHQLYGHQAPSSVAAAQGQFGQPQQAQPQPQPQQPTVYYTQGPDGQTQAIYVNAPPPPPHSQYGVPHISAPPPPPHGFGYATIQYHTGPPPPQVHHHQPQQVVHLNANGQPVGTTQAPPAAPTAYAYYPSTGQYAPVTTTSGQQVVLTSAPGGPHPSMPNGYQHSGVGGGGSPRRSQGLGGSRHGGSRHGGRSNGGYNSRGMDGSGHSGHSFSRNRPNTVGSAAAGPTNPMLEEFRNNKSSASTWTVADIRGHVVDFCRDQNGSRFIQQRLEVAPQSEKDIVMEEVMAASIGGLTALCGDVFGNYVVQKLLEVGDEKMLEDIMKSALIGEMMNLSMQMYG